jgi:hypothetical protein
VRGLAAGAGLAAALACGSAEPDQRPGGTLDVRWTGSDTGQLRAAATAQWCDSLGLMELRAIHGDSGVALALYPADSIVPGDYPVHAERSDSIRFASSVAMRWFAETTIRGFRGDSGTVTVERVAAGVLAGRFTARLVGTPGGSRLTVTGSFDGVIPTPAGASCVGEASDDDPGESEVDQYDEESGGEEEG